MGLLDLLLNRKNCTFDWARDPHLQLVVDLDRHSLCGVSVGQPIRLLSGLGPCDEPRSRGAVFTWRDRGFYIAEENGCLDVFVIFPRTGDSRGYPGRWRLAGQELAISAQTRPDELGQMLGEPFHICRETDSDNELLWFYEYHEAEWQFCWNASGQLESVEINRYQELRDAAGRQSYGCTKPWPFAAA